MFYLIFFLFLTNISAGETKITANELSQPFQINASTSQQYAMTISTNNGSSYAVSVDTNGVINQYDVPFFGVRAYVSFYWDGSNVIIAKSKNVSAVYRDDLSLYRICFQTPLKDINYLIFGSTKDSPSDVSVRTVMEDSTFSRTNSCFRVYRKAANPDTSGNEDCGTPDGACFVAVLGD